MGTIPVPPTLVAGNVLTAANLNAIGASVNFWGLTPRCYSYQGTTGTTLGTSGTWGVLGFDAEVYDIVMAGDTAAHDTVTLNSRVFARTTGKYEFSAGAQFASNATGLRAINVRLNAAGAIGSGTDLAVNYQSPVTGQPTSVGVPTLELAMTAGDYLEVFGYQTSGGSLATQVGLGRTFLRLKLTGS